MPRFSALFSRVAAACALVLVAALLTPAGSSAEPTAGELSYACALKSNGLMRAVTSLDECTKNETKVTLKPGPHIVCIQPSGSTRLAKSARDCRPPAAVLTLPPLSGTVYFCATLPSGALRWVTGPGECLDGEVEVQVTPNDDAPAVTSTSPADGATDVGTAVSPTVTFSEDVTAASVSFAFVCDGTPVAFALTGSGGSTVTLDPTASLTEGVACSITAYAAGVSDVDPLDPPDHPVADHTFSFTTDSAPYLVSSSPVGDAVGVATSTDVVLTFNEPVDVTAGAFTLACSGPALPYAVTGSGTSVVTVNPDADLPETAACTLSAAASGLTDSDVGDPPDALTGAISVTFTTVDSAPSVASTSPGDGATNVATTADVTVTFSEPVSLAPGAFSLACDGGPVTTTVGTADQTTFTFSPASALTAGASCTGSVDKDKVTDTDTVDPPDTMLADHSFSFTVDTPPAVSSTDPADDETDVPAGQVLTVTFTEPVTVTSDAFVLTCNGGAVPFALAGSGTSTVSLTPTSDLPGTASCTLRVVAVQVHDVDAGDPPDTMTADVTIHFTTVDTAPSVVSTSPANGATDVAGGSAITVTFSEPVTADAGAFALECPAGTTKTFASSGAGTAVWTLTPDAALPANTACALTITGSTIHDVDVIDPPDEMTSDVTVEFTVAANSAPTNLALSASSVPENQPSGTAVGTFSSTDPDPGDTFTYTLAAGAGDTDNGSFAIVGSELRTDASFDFETKNSYSVNVRTTDSAGNFFEKSFQVTVTDVNEAPTDISLTNASVPENEPAGTVVGALSASDPDAGQTHTFVVVTSGCGGTYAAGTSFAVNSGSLVTAAALDYEGESSYTVCVRVTDSGSLALSLDEVFVITVTNVNEAPVVGGDSYSGAIGNTLAVRGVTATGPSTTLSGALPLANDSDPEGDALSVVAGTTATTGGGSATINADGTFSYLPGVGDASQTDSFTYTVSDGQLTSNGTISIVIGADRVWWVNAAAAPGGDGRSTAPFTTLTPVNGVGGAGDPDAAGDHIFVYAGAYAGGLVLESTQRLHGQRHGLTVGSAVLVPAGATAPTITNAAGHGLTLANGVDVQGVTVSGASADGIHGDNITTATIGSAVTLASSTADGIDLTGAATGSVAVAATVTGSAGRSVNVSNRTGGTTTFSGPITGAGIALSSNTGAAIAFSAALTISSGANSAFSATGGGTVTASDLTSTLTSTTGSTLVVENTSIGTSGLTFRSVSANGAANGIRLNATGAAGGLSVVGGGNTGLGGNGSGGTIQNTTGPGVSLTSTAAVSLNNLTVSNTPAGAGIKGTGVAGFAFTNGTVSGSGSAAGGAAGSVASNIAFDTLGDGVSNVSGAVTVSNSVLANGYNHGLTIYNNAGTISNLTVTGNTITSAATTAGSIGSGVLVQALGSAGTGTTIATGSISSNTITGFPSGSGIRVTGGNATSLAAPISQIGTSGSHFVINANQVRGHSVAVPMATEVILVLAQGRGASFIDVTNNGSVATPVGLGMGDGISVGATWQHNLTSAISNNIVSLGPVTSPLLGRGLTGGAGPGSIPGGTGDSAVLTATINNNLVSQTKGIGIYFVADDNGTLRATVQDNNVAAPTQLGSGIRLDSTPPGGNVGKSSTMCATISGNTSAGFGGVPGIALRKEGTDPTVNRFGITGLSPSPTTTAADTTNYVASQNAGSVGGVVLVSAQTGFTTC